MIYRSMKRLFALAAALAAFAPAARAQAVDASLSLVQPGSSVSYALNDLYDADRPRVVIVRPAAWSAQDAASLSAGRDAVYSWEVFLLGLQIPYRTVESGAMGRGVPKDVDLVLVPAADALGSSQRRKLLEYVERGGALITSGRLGALDERGRVAGDTFFSELLGAEAVTGVPDQPFGLLHSIDGLSPVSPGVEPGFRLNVAALKPLSAARVVTGRSFGRPYSYSGRDDDRLADLTLMVGNERGSGRVFWTRFNPQDVSRERDQQLAYQRMMINAIAYVTRHAGISVAAWPHGRPSALVVTTLPSVGFDAVSYLGGWTDVTGLLREAQAPATFFLASREALGFPELVRTMSQLGEIAVAGESDDVIAGLPHDVQAQKLGSARRDLGASGGLGVYPPGGFYDGNTVRAILEGGFSYLLLPAEWSLAPGLARWWDDVDYRAVQASAVAGELPFLGRLASRSSRSEGARAEPVMTMPLDPGLKDFPTRFDEIHRAGGLYVLPYYPELSRAGSGRFGQLRDAVRAAKLAGSWVTTLGEVARWWSARAQVSVRMRHSGGIQYDVELQNDGPAPVEGLTLLVRAGDVGFQSAVGDAFEVSVTAGDVPGTYEAVIDRLPTGTSHLAIRFF